MKLFAGRSRRFKKMVSVIALATLVLGLSGCQTISFYAQAAKGQYQIFAHQQPLEKVIADPATTPLLKARLELVQHLRIYADEKLHLPVDGHYRSYVDLHRPFVVWNVQAAPEFSLEPKTWWYPLVGSLDYRGYFSREGATRYAAWLRKKKGYDLFVGGVEAYSTLGWFKDPVLNTFIEEPDASLAELLFHELAHQTVFARGDTDFNEAFATTVGEEGALRWLAGATDGQRKSYTDYLHRNNQFVELIMKTRGRLEVLYGDTRDKEGKLRARRQKRVVAPEELRRDKEQILRDLRNEFAALKQSWGGDTSHDFWFSREVNNAQLNSVAAYYDLVPGFQELLKVNAGDLSAFYTAAERLAKMPRDERHEWLRVLAQSGSGKKSPI